MTMQLWIPLLVLTVVGGAATLALRMRRNQNWQTTLVIAITLGLATCVALAFRSDVDLPGEPVASDTAASDTASGDTAAGDTTQELNGSAEATNNGAAGSAAVDAARDLSVNPDLGVNNNTEIPVAIPRQVADDAFVSSSQCRECHTEYHASWHQTYHRRMTQVLTPETMAAPATEVTLETDGLPYRYWREDDEYWVEMVDPQWEYVMQKQGREYEAERDAHLVKRRLVMSTGSHHYQAYWVNNGRGNEMFRFPWIYHIGANRWLPTDAAFVSPPDQPSRVTIWNHNCIQCHTVHGKPGPDYQLGAYVSEVAELGIACEACHGPGEKHVLYQRQQAKRVTSAGDANGQGGAKGGGGAQGTGNAKGNDSATALAGVKAQADVAATAGGQHRGRDQGQTKGNGRPLPLVGRSRHVPEHPMSHLTERASHNL